MRRAVASCVVGVPLWGFVAPLALAVTTDTTPACCRRNGKHHCQPMSAMVSSPDKVPSTLTSRALGGTTLNSVPYAQETGGVATMDWAIAIAFGLQSRPWLSHEPEMC